MATSAMMNELNDPFQLFSTAHSKARLQGVPDQGVPEIQVCTAWMTPEISTELLNASEVKNRDWKPANRKAYGDAMWRKKFEFNGQTIILDRKLNVLDGHHRLAACVASGAGFWALVVIGIERGSMSTIDTGAHRDVADDLTISCPAHRILNRRVAASLGLILKYATGVRLPPRWMTVPGRREILDSNPEIMSASAKVDVPAGKAMIRESVLGALYYLGGIAYAEQTDRFVRQLVDGANLSPGDPAHTVRAYLIATMRRLSSSRSNMNNWEVFRTCCLGLTRLIEGGELKIIRVPKRPHVPGAEPKVLIQKFGLEEE